MEGSKWQASLEIPVVASLERVWEIASDFCGFKKWNPTLDTCERVEGTPDEGIGCVRYCAGARTSSSSPHGILWVKEKLVFLDCANHSYTYTIIDGNMEGLHGYQATFQVIQGAGAGQCFIKWHFQLDPVAGSSQEDFLGFLSSHLTAMTKSLEEIASAE